MKEKQATQPVTGGHQFRAVDESLVEDCVGRSRTDGDRSVAVLGCGVDVVDRFPRTRLFLLPVVELTPADVFQIDDQRRNEQDDCTAG